MFLVNQLYYLFIYFAVQSKDILRNYATVGLKNVPVYAHFNLFCVKTLCRVG